MGTCPWKAWSICRRSPAARRTRQAGVGGRVVRPKGVERVPTTVSETGSGQNPATCRRLGSCAFALETLGETLAAQRQR
jgi:hypothetical protein